MTTAQRPDGVINTPVVIVGAGPVGCVLALELAHHGVRSMVVERATTPSRHPKMDYVSGRTMELLRRLGVTGELRQEGIAAEHPARFLWTLGFERPPVAVWHHPSVAEWAARFDAAAPGAAPLEPYQRVQGSLLESLLRRRVARHPLIDLREGWTFSDLHQDADGVTATVVEGSTRSWQTLRARYLAACDGARSAVRECLGIGVDTSGSPTQHCSVYFTSSDPVLTRWGRSFVTISARGLTLVSRDEDRTWTGSVPLDGPGPLTDDPVHLLRERLGVPFEVDEVKSVAQWEGSLSVATTYRRGAVFLVGDAAHQFYPTGGHGANTGIADAVDLGWKLAACLGGWGGQRLLDSYERERRPVALWAREVSANLLEVWRRFGRLGRTGASPEFLAGWLAEEEYQHDNLGVHFGVRYEESPVVVHEDGPPPRWSWREVVPTTWPGGRAPSLDLADGTPIFDALGHEFTLVDLSGRSAGCGLAKAAADVGVPLTHLVLDDARVREVWERDLVLVRPDHHVAWRGDASPANWADVLDHVRGA